MHDLIIHADEVDGGAVVNKLWVTHWTPFSMGMGGSHQSTGFLNRHHALVTGISGCYAVAMQPSLFHVSEQASIAVFEPRPSTVFPSLGSVVWAVAESHLVNYLLPRDCPRVTFCATPNTTDADRQRFNVFGSSRVVAIATGWVERVKSAALYVYELPAKTFTLRDESAGYWVSGESVVPRGVRQIADLQTEIRRRGGDLRVTECLKPLQDEVVASTLDYSIIRMRRVEI